MIRNRIEHPIPPFFTEDSRILILGSFPSVKTRESGFFYGHPQNRFWKVIANDLSDILDRAPIGRIFVNGRTAERYYQQHTEAKIHRAAICLPSTSPANAAWKLEDLIEKWKIIR